MNMGCASFRRLMSRRRFFEVGGAGMFGLAWSDFFRAQAKASGGSDAPGKAKSPGKAKQVIFIFLRGGPPQQDMFDMKPDQPEEVRGPFKPIQSKVPGLDVCEHLPRLSRVADKFTILRSVNAKGYPQAGDHFGGSNWKTGNPRGILGTPKYPTYGNVTSKLLPTPQGLPSFVVMGALDSMSPGVRENYLGPAYNHLDISLPGDPQKGGASDGKSGGSFVDLTRLNINESDLQRNAELLRALEEQLRQQDKQDALLTTLDRFQQKAFDMLRSPKLRDALDLDKESDKTRELYGYSITDEFTRKGYAGNYHCPRILAARRLIEAGVPFVYLDFGYWDWHNGRSVATALPHFHQFDAAMSSLLEDLDQRGLLDTTMVVALGEMGRTPKASRPIYGREHWAAAQFVFVAGGGWRRGAVVGATDAQAAYVKNKEYKVGSLGKTIYHLLGIDPEHELYTTDNRPMKIITEDVPLIKEAIA
ncbi:hypothetical protein AYO44_00915 [Planctomycetaceae bacterium SCGC AG-212-F19]|nr:hypothetical protein AYO44_00915 [Planctomycetaceae bacterium SCGC AG-212-F19]